MAVTQCGVLQLVASLLLCLIMIQLPEADAFGFHRESKKTKCLNPPRTARRVESVIAECQEEVKTHLVGEALLALKEDFDRAQEAALHTVVDSAHFLEDHAPPLPPVRPPSTTLSWESGGGDVSSQSNHHHDADEEHSVSEPLEDEDFEGLPSNKAPIKTAAARTTTTPKRKQPESTTVEWQPFLPTVPPSERAPVRARSNAAQSLLRRRIRSIDDIVTSNIYHPTLVPQEDKRIAGCLLHCVYAKNNAIDELGWPTLDGLVDFYSEGVNEHGFFMATLRSVNLCLNAVTKKYHVDRRRLPEKGESCDLAFDVFDCISDQITGYCLDQYKH